MSPLTDLSNFVFIRRAVPKILEEIQGVEKSLEYDFFEPEDIPDALFFTGEELGVDTSDGFCYKILSTIFKIGVVSYHKLRSCLGSTCL